MREINLSKGYLAQVDDEDYARCMEGPKWYAREVKHPDGTILNVYSVRNVHLANGKYTMLMHRFILGITDPGIKVDHEDHNGLNNQRYNLRKATGAQNVSNARLSSVNTSGFKGVSWDKATQKWRAQIMVNGKNKHLRLFLDKREAAQAYDLAAVKYHGEFACTNAMLQDSVST